MSQQKIVIAATFASEPIRLPLSSWLETWRWPHQLKFAPYNQVFQQLLDPASHLGRNVLGLNVLLVRLEDWLQSPDELEVRLSEFLQAVRTYASLQATPTIVCVCPETPTAEASLQRQLAQAEARLRDTLADLDQLQVVLSREVLKSYSIGQYGDAVANQTAHIPYKQTYFAALATRIARHVHTLQRQPYKVIAVDCDNSLWGGVCGEDGPLGVQVTPQHQQFQQRLLDLRSSGLLLALCSKNNEQDVWDVFEQHPQMQLRRSHITAAAINWNSKSSNLQLLADQLRLGLDSFIFLDDSPLECAEVQAKLRQVLSLQLPATPHLTDFLDHVWVFDKLKVTAEDQQRAESYRQEQNRQADLRTAPSLREFLQSLNLEVSFLSATPDLLPRLAQLMQRTNQFNCTLRRYNERELGEYLDQPQRGAFAVEVGDKFGRYGVVGACLYQINEQVCVVDNLLLSCRALGRGVERHILRHIGRLAREQGCREVLIDFVRGPRNAPAHDFLSGIGRDHGRPTAHGTTYVFPLSLILQLDPLAVSESASPNVEPLPARTESAEPAPSALISRIANELQTAEQITRDIASRAVPRPALQEPYVPPASKLEQDVSAICAEVLHVQRVGMRDALQDLGAGSLQIVLIHSRLDQELHAKLTITELYALPTMRAIVDRITQLAQPRPAALASQAGGHDNSSSNSIAVIGMAGRFPGAANVRQLWENLVQGACSIHEIKEEELNLPANSPLRENPNLVRKAASVADADKFDAGFFGIYPMEATVMDPQHRLMLECCWHAIEDAGYNVDSIHVPVGVFAGCYMDTYILSSLATNPALLEGLADSFHGGDLHTELGNDKDYLATRISFLLNLRGPSLTVQTACSTSLVAIAQACQALTSRQCDMALAGGATLKLPQNRGYLYTEGGMVSPDGVCRTFDAQARGTVFGEGVAAVLLKRLEDAVADGDDIYAVIKGCGLNNDGRAKMGYTAPSVEGQAGAIEIAHRQANVTADSITYVEAHGTGTALGDPIEVDALTRAFRKTTGKSQYCAIGSLKTNIGHLDVAAGVAGLIKTSLALRNRVIPPSLHFAQPNPNIDFEVTPFFVNTQLSNWDGPTPRRAGLSSFGVGGTNAHVVLEEAPLSRPSVTTSTPQLLLLSARSPAALEQMTENLGAHLKDHRDLQLADVAYTLQTGRRTFSYTRAAVVQDIEDAVATLTSRDDKRLVTRRQLRRGQSVAFMMPGQGSQHVNMARDLFDTNRVFRENFEQCAELLTPHLGFDLRDKVFCEPDAEAAAELKQTSVAQTSIFAVSYAVAKCLENYGVTPRLMVGHSVGEFVAACLAGVFSLKDALRLVAFRAGHMQQLPTGSMLAVRLPEAELLARLPTDVTIAAINSPTLCVVSGPTASIDRLQNRLEADEIICQSLHTSHAFHSAMMDPVVEPFAAQLRQVELHPPQIPIVSSVTGDLLSDEQATDPDYWARHLRETVRFTDAVSTLCAESDVMLLEVGPGQTLSTLARQHPRRDEEQAVLSSLPHAKQAASPAEHLLLTLGRLWQHGVDVDWNSSFENESRLRLHLPGYPFERKRFWFESVIPEATGPVAIASQPPANHGPESQDSVRQGAVLQDTVTQGDQPVSLARVAAADMVGDRPPAAEPHASQSNALDDVTKRVIQQQLQLMKRQLETWGG